MRTRLVRQFVVCALLGVGISGCGNTTESGAEIATVRQAVVGVDEFLYLRCNATGWGADATTRLTDADGDGLYTLDFDISQLPMITSGDHCVITRTNSASGWGTASTTFGAATSNVVVPPAQWSLGVSDSSPAMIRYPALGRYRATVNWQERTVTISAIQTASSPSFYYLRCNATSWNVGSSNRLTSDSGPLKLSYNVTQSWMTSGGDQCVVTRTNQLNGWGTAQASIGTATATTIVVPTGGVAQTTVTPAGQYFTVRYPALGAYEARLDPTTGQLRIGTFGPDAPNTGLHGAVESLGENRVRVTYDFQSAEQLLDFAAFDSETAAVSIVNGRLVVAQVASNGLVAAHLIKGFKVDSMTYQAELVSGNHINVYVGAIPDGSWNPSRGYAFIHNTDGRLFVANSQPSAISGATPVSTGTVYSGRIDTSEAALTWTLGSNAQTLTYPYYGGTSRTIALGGWTSTVAFDNLMIEGTVEGFESDGIEIDPTVLHGSVEELGSGQVRISYNFSDEQQKFDFVPANPEATRRELNSGRLIVSTTGASDILKAAITKYELRVTRVAYHAELLAGNHVNVYANTIWGASWAPALGCAAIHRGDGRLVAVNGNVSTSTGTPVALRTPYQGDILLSSGGVNWILNGSELAIESPCYNGTDGVLGLGGWDSDVAFDDIVLEGVLLTSD